MISAYAISCKWSCLSNFVLILICYIIKILNLLVLVCAATKAFCVISTTAYCVGFTFSPPFFFYVILLFTVRRCIWSKLTRLEDWMECAMKVSCRLAPTSNCIYPKIWCFKGQLGLNIQRIWFCYCIWN